MRSQSLVLLLVLSFLVLDASVPTAIAKPGSLYQATWGGTNYDYSQAVAQDSAGNTYVTGYTWSFTPGTPSIFLLKFSSSGGLLMQKLWTDNAYDYAYGIALDRSGNIYVSGWTNNLGGPSILLIKFNPSGGLVWQKTYAGSSHPSYGQGAAVDSLGNIYVAGYYANTGGSDQNATIVKFDSTGNLIWQRSWGGSNPDQGKAVAVDASGNVYMTGFTNSFGSGGADMFLLKFSSTGGLLNQITWGGNSDDKTNGIALDSSGNVYITGNTLSAGLTSDLVLLKFTPTGSLGWRKLYALTGATVGYGVAVNPSSGHVWIGGSTIIGAYTKGLALRLDSAGGIVSQMSWGATGGSDLTSAVANDISGNAVIVGYVSESGPYVFTNMTGTLSDSSLNAANPVTPATDPGFSLGFASGSVSTPMGITQYAGGSDVFLSKFGTLPLILFSTSPPDSGTITFDGTLYSSGGSGSYSYGTYTVKANPATDYLFTGWTVTGDLSVSDPLSNSTKLTVAGPGTLTANFAITIADITVQISPDGAGTLNCNGMLITGNQTVNYPLNSTFQCTANAYSGFKFVKWSGLSSDTSENTNFTVRASGILEADFAAIQKTPSLIPSEVLLGSLPILLVMIRRRKAR